MRISVILPTVRPWPEVDAALTSCLAQDNAESFEILVMDGHGDGLAAAPEPPVRWMRVPGADVFHLRARGVAGDAVLDHLQHWQPAEAVAVHFQSGRSYGASVRCWPTAARRAWWRSLTRLPGHLYRRTAPTMAEGAASDRAWLAALILANTLGQATGVLRGAGQSRRRLV